MVVGQGEHSPLAKNAGGLVIAALFSTTSCSNLEAGANNPFVFGTRGSRGVLFAPTPGSRLLEVKYGVQLFRSQTMPAVTMAYLFAEDVPSGEVLEICTHAMPSTVTCAMSEGSGSSTVSGPALDALD